MKHLLFAMCLSAALAGAGQPTARATVEGTWRADSDNYWTRSNSERWISLQLQHDGSNNGLGIPERDLPALADRRSDGPIHFTLRRDAGLFDFTGRIDAGRGRGDFTFTPDADFISGMGRLGYARLPIDKLVELRIHGVTPDFIRGMAALGFKDQTLSDLVTFRIHGITPDFIKAFADLGYKNLAAEDLVKMRIHGVSPQMVKELNELG